MDQTPQTGTYLVLDHDSAIKDVIVGPRDNAIERAREIARTEGTVWVYASDVMVNADGSLD